MRCEKTFPSIPNRFRVFLPLSILWINLLILVTTAPCLADDPLADGWNHPPLDARIRAYWWWLNGNVTSAAITRDLEEMKAKGFGGAVITDADGSSQDGNERAPHGPTFFSPEWRALYKHTLREADRLGLEMSLSILSGWNLGGPMVKPEDAAKKLTWAEIEVIGPTKINQVLPAPKRRDNFYQDLFIVAYRQKAAAPNSTEPVAGAGPDGKTPIHKPLQNWEQKAVHKTLTPFSAPDSTPLFQEYPEIQGEEDTRTQKVVDLTSRLSPDGTLQWDAPVGTWHILRFGCTIGDHSRVSTCSQGWDGYALDVLDAGAFERYWDAVVEPLIADAGPLAGKSLRYLHTDSWEVEAINWTPTLREEFRQRRGYDLLPYTPALAGRIVNSRTESNRFLHDFRKTLGDLAIDNHYRLFRDRAHKHGLLIHPESGGPHAVPIDAQRCLGFVDAPMSEFWAWSWRHRIGDDNRFFVKQPASAAHTYGRKLVLAEGFTTIGPHWQETLWDNLKPSFDKAACEGMNLLVWHAFVCSPEEMGIPGQQYFAGTHLNPNVTWWKQSAPVFDYFNRCHWMLQQGLFVADVCYYYGDHVPNFTRHKQTDPARILPGYDYDVITEEAILTRMSVQDGQIVLPDGMNYRMMVLPDRTMISLPVLRKLKEHVKAGAIILGPKPDQATGLKDYPQCDQEVKHIANEMWGPTDTPGEKQFGNGRVLWGKSARQVLATDGIKPDFEVIDAKPDAVIDSIHRHNGNTEIYFIANRLNRSEQVRCIFRVTGKGPELWDPVSGQHRFAAAYTETEGRTILPLEFNPCGSVFVVFRDLAENHPASTQSNREDFIPGQELTGPWEVRFDPRWGGPEATQFDSLVSWISRTEPGIKYYSGTAAYTKSFDLPEGLSQPGRRLFIDLGNLRELAAVRLNGKSLGVLWTPPFRADITDVVKSADNKLEVEVTNFWPNRIIGDQFLPAEKRLTKTNIRKLTKDTALMESGLLGPVTIQCAAPNKSDGFNADARPLLHIAYFIPSDRQPEPDRYSRLDRVMTEVRRFYREGMKQNGFGPMTFELDRNEQGQLKIHEVRGAEPMHAYGRDGYDKVRQEVRDALAKEGLDIDNETIVIFQVLLQWNQGKAVEIGPYVGGGDTRSGTAWVYDDAKLDPLLLSSKQPGGFYHSPCSLGQFNTHYIGGITHELGHALGLPHDRERDQEQTTRGTSLMGSGNHTYGEDLRNEGRGTFLSAASAMPLSLHPLFTGKKKPPVELTCRITELTAVADQGVMTLTGRLQDGPRAIAMVAYNDREDVPDDYDALGWVCSTDPQGRFRLRIEDLKPGSYELRIRALSESGDSKTFTYHYQVDPDLRPDIAFLLETQSSAESK